MNEMNSSIERRVKRQAGAALLITSLILVLVSMLALSAIVHSEQEATGGARSRSSTRAFYGADAGVDLALGRLEQSPPNLNSFDIDLADGTNIQSRSRAETSPQVLSQVGTGETKEGWSVNVGTGAGYVTKVYEINVTASSGGSTVEVESRLIRGDADTKGY